jgi:hypothetical protein
VPPVIKTAEKKYMEIKISLIFKNSTGKNKNGKN